MPDATRTEFTERLPLADADIRYTPGFVQQDSADHLLRALLDGIDWQQHNVRLFGRQIAQPRLSAWFGDAGIRYRYSGLDLRANGWPSVLLALRAGVEAQCDVPFNSVLLNRYRDGRDGIGMHSDDEPELGARPVIAALSLGAARPLVLRHRTRADLAQARVVLGHGSLLEMRGATQSNWRHGMPPTRAHTTCGPRVSLTFRFVFPAGSRPPADRAASLSA